MQQTRRLEWLEAMRGVAAGWVLLHHAGQAARDFSGMRPWPAVLNGYLGVNFFFILSGFIIAYSSQQLVASGRGFREYATARAIRIYVPYLPVGLAMLALYALFPGLSYGTRAEVSVLSSVLLLPASAPPALSVAWTLVHEMLFYAVFSLFFWSRAALVAALAAWVAAIICAWLADLHVGLFWNYFLSPLNLCFAVGVGLAWATRESVRSRAGIAAASLGLLLVASQAVQTEPNSVLVSIGFACLVVASRSEFAIARSPGPVLMLLGAASYAIYLVHNPAISVAIRGTRYLAPIAAFGTAALIALFAGVAYHLLYERPALRKVRTLWPPKRGSAVEGPAQATLGPAIPPQELGDAVDSSRSQGNVLL